MERTQISLEPGQAQRLRHLARERGVSMAHLIREAVDRVYGATPADAMDAKWERAMKFVRENNVGSGLPDLGQEHDRYLDEIYGDW